MYKVVYTIGELGKILTERQSRDIIEDFCRMEMLNPAASEVQISFARDATSITVLSEDVDFLSLLPHEFGGFERDEPVETDDEFREGCEIMSEK